MTNEDLQKALQAIGYYKGRIDGMLGPESHKAIDALLEAQRVNGFKRWSQARRTIAAKQVTCRKAGIDVGTVDGLVGPQTQYAFEVWVGRATGDTSVETWRDKEAEDKLPPVQRRTTYPTQRDVEKFYGNVGQNQAMVNLPFPLRIAWDREKKVTRISLHEKVADSARRVLERVADHYPHERRQTLGLDLFGGSLNVRKMRGGSAWSMHAWGIAIDFDPARNQLKWNRDQARLAKDDCATFWRLWDEEGWLSLGRARNYDWMHVQAARL